jgi:hypothetical protein
MHRLFSRTRICAAIVFLASTGVLVGGAVARSATPKPKPKPKPLPALIVSPTGNDRAACTQAAPCLSIDAAYRRAQAGQTVRLEPGTYPRQRIRADATKNGVKKRVVVAPSAAGVSLPRISVDAGAGHIEFRNFVLGDGWDVGDADDGAPATDIVFRNITAVVFRIENAASVSVLGGSYGPAVDRTPQIKVYNPGNQYLPTDILVDGVLFHDFTRSNRSVHTECLQVYAGLRVTIRRSRFTNCDGTGDLALTTLSSTRLQDVLVENNWFDRRGDATAAIQADISVERLVFRYNSATKPLVFTRCTQTQCGSARLVGNYMPWNPSTCTVTATYAHNVFSGGTCGPTDVAVSSLAFANADGFDLHLARQSPALCRGDWSNHPKVDIDGQARPAKLRPDAGADQQPKRRTDPKVLRRCKVRPKA